MLKMRIAIEQLIARKTLQTLIDAGYLVTVNDGEDDVVKDSNQVEICLAAMFSTDEDFLKVKPDTTPGAVFKNPPAQPLTKGWIRFIYGNDGWDVINDHTVNLESILQPVSDLCEIIDTGGYTIEVTPDIEGKAWNKP